MLSALMPGVRELRTPLVTGALWAACFWVLFGARITGSKTTEHFVERLGLENLPSAVWFGAGSLLVYLIGSLLVVRKSPLEALVRRMRPRISRWVERLDEDSEPPKLRHRFAWKLWRLEWRYRRLSDGRLGRAVRLWGSYETRYDTVDAWLSNEFDAMVVEGRTPVMRSFEGGCDAPNGFEGFYATSSLSRHPAFDEGYELRSNLAQTFIREVKREQPAVEVRIQMRFPEVYSEIDRLKVESELRLSIFWPLMLLSVLLAWAWSPVALLLAVFPPFFLRDGFKRAHDASEKTWSALVAGEVTSPILDAMAAAKNEECRDFAARYRRKDDSASLN